MTRICAWCGKHLGERPGEGVTHGMCQDCADKMIRRHGLPPAMSAAEAGELRGRLRAADREE